MRQIKKIIIHCSATKEGADFHVSDVRKWHQAKGWCDCGYHFVITLSGAIELGRPLSMMGAHCQGQNADSIGICYIGGLDKDGKAKDTRTDAQKDALRVLIELLKKAYKIDGSQVFGHRDFTSGKACPCFDVAAEKY